jgi:hypothetical protein
MAVITIFIVVRNGVELDKVFDVNQGATGRNNRLIKRFCQKQKHRARRKPSRNHQARPGKR